METEAKASGYVLGQGEGEARWWLGGLATIKATGKETDGRYSLVEVVDPEGSEAPLHVHHREDEGFWVLEGELTSRQPATGPGQAARRWCVRRPGTRRCRNARGRSSPAPRTRESS
jgi:hypothetical protein